MKSIKISIYIERWYWENNKIVNWWDKYLIGIYNIDINVCLLFLFVFIYSGVENVVIFCWNKNDLKKIYCLWGK